jgi:hypothetical protein
LLAEVARLTAERQDLKEEQANLVCALDSAVSRLEILRTRLRGLEQHHGFLLPDRDADGKPLGTVSSVSMIRADELARLLTTPEEPNK